MAPAAFVVAEMGNGRAPGRMKLGAGVRFPRNVSGGTAELLVSCRGSGVMNQSNHDPETMKSGCEVMGQCMPLCFVQYDTEM